MAVICKSLALLPISYIRQGRVRLYQVAGNTVWSHTAGEASVAHCRLGALETKMSTVCIGHRAVREPVDYQRRFNHNLNSQQTIVTHRCWQWPWQSSGMQYHAVDPSFHLGVYSQRHPPAPIQISLPSNSSQTTLNYYVQSVLAVQAFQPMPTSVCSTACLSVSRPSVCHIKGALHQPYLNLSTCLTTVLNRKCIAPTTFKQASLLKRHLKISGQSCPLKFKRLAKMRQTPSLFSELWRSYRPKLTILGNSCYIP